MEAGVDLDEARSGRALSESRGPENVLTYQGLPRQSLYCVIRNYPNERSSGREPTLTGLVVLIVVASDQVTS